MSKYRAVPITIDGHRFASKAEARRYGELVLLERAGMISALELQPSFPLVINGQSLGRYIADFQYVGEAGKVIIEDVKGMPGGTPLYRLKRKLVEALYGITITEMDA